MLFALTLVRRSFGLDPCSRGARRANVRIGAGNLKLAKKSSTLLRLRCNALLFGSPTANVHELALLLVLDKMEDKEEFDPVLVALVQFLVAAAPIQRRFLGPCFDLAAPCRTEEKFLENF